MELQGGSIELRAEARLTNPAKLPCMHIVFEAGYALEWY